MIGYLFLGLALLCGVLKGYCGKRSGGTLVFASDALAVNTVRMLASLDCSEIKFFSDSSKSNFRFRFSL